jgi:voltage-gated potassium channel
LTDEATRTSRNEEALERFERQIAVPMLVLSLAIVPLIVIPLVADLSRPVRNTFIALDWLVWAAFVVEYLVRLYLAPHKWTFFRHNLFDLLIVVLPFLRPLRVIRSARAARLLGAGRATTFLGRGVQSAREILTRHNLHYVLMVGVAVVLVGAVVVREYEHTASGSNIHTFPDALWWAISTTATVGGDKFPVTAGGRAVAVVLMLFGVGVFGLLAASFASFFVGRRAEEEVEPKIDAVLERLGRIEAALAASNGGAAEPKEPRGPATGEPAAGDPLEGPVPRA